MLTINSVSFPLEFEQKFRMYLENATEYEYNLHPYQKITTDFFTKSNVRGMLGDYELGGGKSRLAIACAIALKKPTIIFSPGSLKSNFLKEFKKMGLGTDEDFKKKFKYATSNAPNKYEQLLKAAYKADKESYTEESSILEGKFLIIDEAHRIISLIINPNSQDGTKIFDLIFNTHNLKLLLLSGSPLVNNPFELSIIANLCKGPMNKSGQLTKPIPGGKIYNILPLNYKKFNETFLSIQVSQIDDQEIERAVVNEQILKERLVGLVSFYAGSPTQTSVMPKILKNVIVRVRMSGYQFQKYIIARENEREEEKKYKHTATIIGTNLKIDQKEMSGTYRSASRHISNFAFMEYIKYPDFTGMSYKERIRARKNLIPEIINQIKPKDLSKKSLEIYSPKMLKLLNNIENAERKKILIYSQFKELEGIRLFGKILEVHGWTDFASGQKGEPGKTFGMWHSDVPVKDRENMLSQFNDSTNTYGDNIRVIMITEAGSEGHSMLAVREVHIMEPYWNETRPRQVVGRARRMYSHSKLKENERDISIFVYHSILPENLASDFLDVEGELSTDQLISKIAYSKQKILTKFMDIIRQSSIDCLINSEDTSKCLVCAPIPGRKMFKADIEEHMMQTDACIVPLSLDNLIKIPTTKKEVLGFNIVENIYQDPATHKYYIKIPKLKPSKYFEVTPKKV